ncbi:hypothetical protein [[Mycobacterium] zoologicum]|uniref:hypothetical protein n=1 Tax=[Mycobacterium] zoologicum TaxID=2872311 RepID=UPI0039E074F0
MSNLAVHALTAAFAAKSTIVDEKSARIAVTESVATDTPRRHHTDAVTTPTKTLPATRTGSSLHQ